ncbi:FtsK/SpoIIIE domain-containing protein [Homoserinibacter sp. GY 40078]|uniref:FtsK/SpoIIIE domain-containing protein n=1 Tax=Homoserinibacter sp. GY 40078 TaxID=2603275 RepID=UPI0021045AA5|nr:FtsK/SpoIIIE domain-containing protein [Homoserinibacter sp. GY 40078]
MALVMWVLTSSPFALMFAVLGPVVALASLVDGRRSARRERQRQITETATRLDELRERILGRENRLRQELVSRVPDAHTLVAGEIREVVDGWLLGWGRLPSGIELVSEGAVDIPQLGAGVSAVRQAAATVSGAPVVVPVGSEVGVESPSIRAALARSLVIQAAAACAPGTAVVTVPPGEDWALELPHRVQTGDHWAVTTDARRLVRVAADDALRLRVRIDTDAPIPVLAHVPEELPLDRPALLGSATALHLARRLAHRAHQAGWRSDAALPGRVSFSSVVEMGVGPRVALGMDPDGAQFVDLTTEGPHALVAGTTGSGKSELLVTWVLALAAASSPAELSILLIDFKGGATFAPLAALPHVVGVVDDLDERAAARAVASLRAEMRRRERVLAERGARSIAELPSEALPRLVVVIDEFAALMSLDPGAEPVLADLAARGRSLGMHLVLCTQRPAGVVRDAVLANVTVRICLRVLDPADSRAVIGTALAAELPADSRGRAVLGQGGDARRFQVALADQDDVAAVIRRWSDHPRPEARPWLDPLPAVLPRSSLPGPEQPGGIVVGMSDLPHEQRRAPLELDPWSGGLLVLGGAASGRTAALCTVAEAAEAANAEIRWVPGDPAELWHALSSPQSGRVLVVADDVDRTLALAETDTRDDLIDLIRAAARDSRRSGLAIAASARGVGTVLSGVHSAFEARILLRMPSRDEHLLAGGGHLDHRPDRRPGSTVWSGAESQLAIPDGPPPTPWRFDLPELHLRELASGRWGIVASHPAEVADALRTLGIGVCSVEAHPPGELGSSGLGVLLGDPDQWLGAFGALGAIRRSGRMLMLGCASSDHRALTRSRAPLPPLGGIDEGWLVTEGRTLRVRVRRA